MYLNVSVIYVKEPSNIPTMSRTKAKAEYVVEEEGVISLSNGL